MDIQKPAELATTDEDLIALEAADGEAEDVGPGPHIVDWDAEDEPIVTDWDAAVASGGYQVDWDVAPVSKPLVVDLDNLSVHEDPSEGFRAQAEIHLADTTPMPAANETTAQPELLDSDEAKVCDLKKQTVVDWDEDELRTPMVMDWDEVSTREKQMPGRNSVMGLSIVDWDRKSIRGPAVMDWDQEAEQRPLVMDWDLIAPARSSSATVETDEVQSEDPRRGKKWVVDDVLLQAAADSAAAERKRRGPGRDTIMRSNVVDWDDELEREAKAKAEAEARAREAEAKRKEAEAKAKAKAKMRAMQSRPTAAQAPRQVFGSGGVAWSDAVPQEEEPKEKEPSEPSEPSFGSTPMTARPIHVEVELEEAAQLTDPPGIEAYVVVSLGDASSTRISKTSETAEKSPNPVWDEVLELTIADPPFATELELVVWGFRKFSFDRHMGTVKIPLDSLPVGKEEPRLCKLEGGESDNGKVQIYVTLMPLEIKLAKEAPSEPSVHSSVKTPPPPPPAHVVEAAALADLTHQMVTSAAASGLHKRIPQEDVRVRVTIEEGTNVYPPVKFDGGSAFAKVILGTEEYRTRTEKGKKAKNPVWKQDFSLAGPPGSPTINFMFGDHESRYEQDLENGGFKTVNTELFLGRASVYIGKLPLGSELDEWYDIQGGLAEDAKVRLKITLLTGHVVLSLPGVPANVHPADEDDNQFMPSGPQSSGWLPITVPLGITSMGWTPIGMAPDRMYIEAILPQSWAVHAKLCPEDELISVAGKDISEHTEDSLIRALQHRPLDITFYRHNWDAEGEVAKKGAYRDPTQDVSLKLDVLEGKNLWAMTNTEVFVVAGIQGGGKPHVTNVQANANPQWNESSTLLIPHGHNESMLELSAWDLELSERDEHLGTLNIPLNKLRMGEVVDWWCVLQGGCAMPGAEVRLRLQLLEDDDADTLDSYGNHSPPKSDSLGAVHLLIDIEEGAGLMKFSPTKLPEEVEAFMVFDAGIGGKPYTTKYVTGLGSLEWKERALIEVTSGSTELTITVWDKVLQLKEEPLGTAIINLEELPVGRMVDEWYDITGGICPDAKIRLRMTLVNTLHTQEAWVDLDEEHSDTEGEHKKQAVQTLVRRVRRLWEPATLQVDVLEGWDLVTKCVAYARVSLGNGVQMQKTGTAMRASNCPKWEKETVMIDLPPAQEVLEVSIWDEDPFGKDDELMGIVQIKTDKLNFGEVVDKWYELTEGPIRSSMVRLRLSVHMVRQEDKAVEHHLHRITVEVVEGSDLRDPGDYGGTDPYVILSLGEDPYITKTANGEENPQWNETATFEIHRDVHALQVTVWDWDPWSKEDLLGGIRIPFGTLPVNQLQDDWYDIHEGISTEGKLHLRITLEGDAVQEEPPPPPPPPEPRKSDPAREALLLKVEVMEGSNITEPTEPDGAESYVVLNFDEDAAYFTSNVAKKSRDPQWNETAEVWVPKLASYLEIQVWDSDYMRDDMLGIARIPLKSLTLNERMDNWYALDEGEAVNAKIHVRLTLEGKEWQTHDLADVILDVETSIAAAPPPMTRHLKVEIVEATDLGEPGTSCDPYVILDVEGEHKTYTTQMIRESLNPLWNETTTFVLPAESTAMAIHIWDSNYLSDALVGKGFVVFSTLLLGTELDQWYSLGEGTAENARIRLKLTLLEQDQVDLFDPFDPEKLKKARPIADLKVEILEGKNMTEPSEPDGCDAYVIVSLGDGQSHTTHAPKQNASPEWNETVVFELQPEVNFLELNVWDWDLVFPDEHLGAARIPLEELTLGEPAEDWYEITGGVAEDGPKVKLRLTLMEKEGATEAEAEAEAADEEVTKHAKLKIAILEGSEMKPETNLYVILELGEGSTYKTEMQDSGKSQKPKWNESTILVVPAHTQALDVSLWDGNIFSSDDNMGRFSIPLLSFQAGNEIDEWFTIEGGTGQGAGGKLRLRLKLLDPRLLLDLPDQRLRVDIVEGKDLTDDLANNDCSAWVSLVVKGDDDPPYKSQRLERTRCPKWDESTIFRIQSMLEVAELEINAWSHIIPHLEYTKDFLGMTRIPLGSLKVGQAVDDWYDISGGKPVNATIRLRLLVLEEDQPDFEAEVEDDSGSKSGPAAQLQKTLGLSEEFRHGMLLFEINSRRVPYVVVPRGLKDFSRLLLVLIFNWGLPSPHAVLRAIGGERHLYSEWLDSCRDLIPWSSNQGALPENPTSGEAYYGSGVRRTTEGRLPVTEDVMSEYFGNFLSRMEALAVDICHNVAESFAWLESDASTMGIAGLLGVGARRVFRSPQAKKFVWVGLYTNPLHKQRSDRNTRKLWEAAVPLNEEFEEPLRIPLEETPQIPQSRTLPGDSEADWNAFRYRHQAFINPWITHLLLFHDEKDRDKWHEYVGNNFGVIGMACNDCIEKDMAMFTEAIRVRKVLLVNHSGGFCDHLAEALKQLDAQKHVYRLNWSGLLDNPIDYKRHQGTFQELGGAWACNLIEKMEQDARSPKYMFEFQGQSDSHVTHPNLFIEKMAAQYKKTHFVIPSAPLELPDGLIRHKVVILDVATAHEADLRRTLQNCLCEQDILEKKNEMKDTKEAAMVETRQKCICGNYFVDDAKFCRNCGARRSEDEDAIGPKRASAHQGVAESPNTRAMRQAATRKRKTANMISMCRFCGAEVPKEEMNLDVDPTTGAPAREASDSLAAQGFAAGCKCRETQAFYHLECLKADFIVRCQAKETPWLDLRCTVCRQPFHGRALLELAYISRGRLAAEHGSQSEEVARAVHFLAVAHDQIGESRVAAQLMADSLAIYEEKARLTGAFPAEMAETLHILAKFYRRPADTIKERQVLERCLAIKEKLFGAGHVETRAVVLDLAAAYGRAGYPRKEQELQRRAATINMV